MTFLQNHMERGWEVHCGRCANTQFVVGGMSRASRQLRLMGWTSTWIDHYQRRRVLCPACSKELL